MIIINMSRYLGFKALESENYFFVSYNSEDSDRIAPKGQYIGIGINEDDIEKNVALTLDL